MKSQLYPKNDWGKLKRVVSLTGRSSLGGRAIF